MPRSLKPTSSLKLSRSRPCRIEPGLGVPPSPPCARGRSAVRRRHRRRSADGWYRKMVQREDWAWPDVIGADWTEEGRSRGPRLLVSWDTRPAGGGIKDVAMSHDACRSEPGARNDRWWRGSWHPACRYGCCGGSRTSWSVRAQRRAATGASRTGAAHVVALRPIGRRDEFADGGGVADEVRKEVHLPCPCPDFRMSLPIDGHHSVEA